MNPNWWKQDQEQPRRRSGVRPQKRLTFVAKSEPVNEELQKLVAELHAECAKRKTLAKAIRERVEKLNALVNG